LAHPAAVDHLAANLAALAAGVLRPRRPQSGQAAGRALPNFSLERLRPRLARRRIYSAKPMGAPARNPDFLFSRRGRLNIRGHRPLAGRPTKSALLGLRLLAHQPELLSDPCGHAARDSDGELRLVPLGYQTTAPGTL